MKETIAKEYASAMQTNPLLSAKEEQGLLKVVAMFKNGKKREIAREKLISSNLKLVVGLASHYSSCSSASGQDLVGEGIYGLVEAVDDYDLKFGTRFCTYAVPKIKLRMLQYLNRSSSAVHVPSHIANSARKCKKIKDGNKDITEKQLMKELNVSKKGLGKIAMTKTHVLSLDDSAYSNKNGDNIKWDEIIADDSAITSEENIVNDEKTEVIEKVLNTLSVKEKDIIVSRFYNQEKQEYHVIGKRWKCTAEAIRQIQNKALKKMKSKIKKTYQITSWVKS